VQVVVDELGSRPWRLALGQWMPPRRVGAEIAPCRRCLCRAFLPRACEQKPVPALGWLRRSQCGWYRSTFGWCRWARLARWGRSPESGE